MRHDTIDDCNNNNNTHQQQHTSTTTHEYILLVIMVMIIGLVLELCGCCCVVVVVVDDILLCLPYKSTLWINQIEQGASIHLLRSSENNNFIKFRNFLKKRFEKWPFATVHL